jgi:phospholipid transport system substrate-binding protein
MIARRSLLAAAVAIAATMPAFRLAAAPAAAPSTVISAFYATLLSAMKQGPVLGFKGRAELLAPAIRHAFDLPLMTRLTVGPQWAELTANQQQQLQTAFSEFSIATYANRFDDYSGERFDVDPKATPAPNGVIVHSKLVQNDGKPVQLDYLMHKTATGWQIVDVYLSGTVSELATRRSEFTSILRRGGADALVEALQKKVAQLGS